MLPLSHTRLRRALLVLAVVVSTAACGNGEDGDETAAGTSAPPVTTAPATTPASTTAPSTLVPTTPPPTTAPPTSPSTSTLAPASTVAPSSSDPATTAGTSTPSTLVCTSIGDRGDEQSGFPGSLSSLVGVEIRTGAHTCFERIVIEFAPGDAPTPAIVPGWWVRYTDEPITLGQTDDQFVELRGAADLLITVEAWMYDVDTAGHPTTYAGLIDLFPTNVSTIEEIRLIDNWEGVQVWAVGLDRVRDLRVSVLDEPVRLVIDVGA